MAKKKEVILPDKNGIITMLEEYEALKKQEKLISERKKLLAETIKAYATENGTKDSNGSYYAENNNFIFGAQCRKSVSLNEVKAVKLFKEKGIYDNVVDLKPVINESKVEEYVALGELSTADIESITDVRVTMAIDVKSKEEVVTAQQATASIAAKKKPKSLLKRSK